MADDTLILKWQPPRGENRPPVYIKDNMKPSNLVIHIAKHIPTGAEVPMLVKNTDGNNVITDYKEFLENRKGFTLSMLQNRWDLPREYVLELLKKYQVPAHVNHEHVKKLTSGQSPADAAIFFEEYIFGLEKKEKLKHTNLKSKKLQVWKGN